MHCPRRLLCKIKKDRSGYSMAVKLWRGGAMSKSAINSCVPRDSST